MKQNELSLLHDKLKEYFGFSSFKGNQEAVIRNVLKDRSECETFGYFQHFPVKR